MLDWEKSRMAINALSLIQARAGQASNSIIPKTGLISSGWNGSGAIMNGGFLKPMKMKRGGGGHSRHKSAIGSIEHY
jgi:hypothetical protein